MFCWEAVIFAQATKKTEPPTLSLDGDPQTQDLTLFVSYITVVKFARRRFLPGSKHAATDGQFARFFARFHAQCFEAISFPNDV